MSFELAKEVRLSASIQDVGEEWMSSFPGGARGMELDQSSIEDETGTGSSSKQILTQELGDLRRKEVHPQEPDQEEMAVEREGISSGLERDAMKKETEKREAEHQTQNCKIYTETDSTWVQNHDKARKEKEPELGAVQQGNGAEIKVNSEKGRKGVDISMGQGDKQESKKRIDVNLEENDLAVKKGGIQSKIDARHKEEQKNLEKSSKNLEKGEEDKKEQKGKFEKKVDNRSGQRDGGEKRDKKDKKDKKNKSSSERIQKKLEKINAKIDRILAKKEEYEVRLKETQEREWQESYKAAPHERELSTAMMGKLACHCNGPGLISEETVTGNGSRPYEDANTKESMNKPAGKGFSSSLSRTASLIEVTSTELMEEVAVQKRVAEKPAKILVNDGREMNVPLPMGDSDLVMKGKGKVFKHTLQVEDSNDTGTL